MVFVPASPEPILTTQLVFLVLSAAIPATVWETVSVATLP